MADIPLKISELPPAQIANDADMYPVVQSADTRRQTLAQLRVAIGIGANVTALNGLTGAADKLAYFTGVGAMALTNLTPLARSFLAATTLGAQQTALALVPQTSVSDFTVGRVLLVGGMGLGSPIVQAAPDLNTVITGQNYYVNSATNAPGGTANGWLTVLPVNASYCAQRFINESTGVVSDRTLLAGVWGSWTGRAKGGANSDITSLTGLTTPLSIAQGGTGQGASAMTNLTLQNSWTVTASRRAVYRKVIDSVQIEMSITGGTVADGTVLTTLPAGFRPPFPICVPVAAFPTVSSTAAATPCVIINTNGTITCVNCATALIAFCAMIPLS